MNQIIPTTADRAALEMFMSKLNQMSPGSDFVITPTDLRMEQPLSANNGTYTFNPRKGSTNTDRPLENKLSQNDLMMVTHIGLAITKQDAENGNYGNYPLVTFPDANFFEGDDGNVPEYMALQNVYQGKLSLVSGTQNRLLDFMTHNLQYVPDAQYVKASAPQTGPESVGYGGSHANRGFYRLHPYPLIDGDVNNEFTVRLGQGDRTLIAGGVDASNSVVDTTNVLVLLVKGFVVSGLANVADGSCQI